MEPVVRPPIGFAHRGARAHAVENTVDAFRLALRLGATGLESDVWLTADGVPVLDHDGVVRERLRKRRFADLDRAALPAHVLTLPELYDACGTGFELSLDVKDDAAAGPVAVAAREAGAESRLWMCHPDWNTVAGWRALAPTARLVNSTRRRAMKEGVERRAASLADSGVDAVNLHHTDWTTGFVTLFHRFDVLTMAWDCQHSHVLLEVLRMGVDAVFSDHTDRMQEAIAAVHR
ncbi:MAG TPA: glycerophosphodiester phosphodiesterase [Acidimicrobiales bacterium]|nr:glycerophosphodiester phosphodiesterase [Acidimicrobiales bacterium]